MGPLTDLHPALADPVLRSMNFLNEVAVRFPEAVSFAPGRPYEEFFDLDEVTRCFNRFRDYLTDQGLDDDQARRLLLQYGRTKGIVHELLARHLAVDENITADPEAIVVTVGCQEAMFLVLRALRADERDVVLAVSPTYVGLSGAARLVDMPVVRVRENQHGLDLDHFVDQIHQTRAAGLRPRALYLVPDFANPSGQSLSLDARHRLLALAQEHDILLLEDNPYGYFGEHDERLPTLKSMDTSGQVVYLGSLAKSCFPGARVGYVIADQQVAGGLFADELSKIKSMLTVNTPPLTQAVVGGKLLEHDGSLLAANKRQIEVYRRNRRLLLDGLSDRFPADGPLEVSWNKPDGGFFVVVDVPFRADDLLLEESARDYGVLWTPMSHFYEGPGGEFQIRLSCSVLRAEQIGPGLDRFQRFIIGPHKRSLMGRLRRT